MLLNTKINGTTASGATLLWENPDSSTSWAGGVVSLPTGYQYLVEFAKAKGNMNTIALLPYTEETYYFGVQISASILDIRGSNVARRINYVRSGEISFGGGYYNGSASNTYFKPLRIWGIK